MTEVLEKVDELTEKLKICETKFEQIKANMEFYENWYVELLTKVNEACKSSREFLGKFTKEDIEQLENVIKAVHGE